MSTGTNKERLTTNNGIITDNNADLNALKTRINNLPTSGDTTATASDIALGKTAVSKGVKITGTYTPPTVSLQSKDVTINQNGTTTITADTGYDGLSDVDVTVSGILDTSDATATANNIEYGKTAYVNGQKITGNIQPIGDIGLASRAAKNFYDQVVLSKYISETNIIPAGYYVNMRTEQSTIASTIGAYAEKIKKNEVICGVTGTYEGTNTPDWSQIGYSSVPQSILDDYAYSKDIYDNWTSSSSLGYRTYKDDLSLRYMPLVDTSRSGNLTETFYNCSNLEVIPLLDFSNVTSMMDTFNGCKKLKEIPLLDTSKVTTMTQTFNSCQSLSNLPLLDTSNVTRMDRMLYNTRITSLPLLNTSKVTNMHLMCSYCGSLTTVPLLDMSNVETAREMFYSCGSLVNVPTFNIPKVTIIQAMFGACPNLSSESLNNILAMCIGATAYIQQGTNMTLRHLGLSSTQATTCQSLSNWNDFVTAGWTSGY